MKPLSLITTLLCLAPAALFAQDWRGSDSHSGRLHPSINSHSGGSPFDPRDEDDTRFVVDTGSGLDTGCTFRDGGPLVITLKVKRYVGDDPSAAASKGLLSKMAHIRMPAYDVDVNGAPGYPPEVDRVSFNGHDLGTLTGDNNIWKLNEFDVPIDWVKFPSKGSPGSPPSPADNVVQIDIDTASPPDFNWCTSIDWVEIEFDAVAPVFLVHGTNAQSDTWNPNFTAFFGNSGAPWSNDINLQANGSILGNGQLLAARVQDLAAMFGAKKCHLIAHSKGGLDTRAFLNNEYDPDKLKVLSVYTLSTPHHGTIESDIIVAKRAATNPESSNPDIKYLIDHDYSWLSTPQPPAIGDQMTTSMAAFNAMFPSVPGDVRFYNYGADADLNHNGHIESGETVDLIPGYVPGFMAAAAGTAMYRAIGNVASIKVSVGTRPGRLWGTNTFTSIEVASTNNPFAVNDLVCSVASAHSPSGSFLAQLAANHSSMKSTALASTIFQHILSDFPIH
ncbi:MAG: hypothetical protein DMF58_09840 [Acidobacteria bacterium]|nr:MAG: hypothetical protein DMF58_09840 [Acidobacteriota bacterium]